MTTLSIIIPAHNEEKTIKTLLERVNKIELKEVRKEIIVVDDFSTDRTPEILKKIKFCKVFRHTRNMGKAAALRTGISKSMGDIILFQDADLEYFPEDYPKLLEPMLRGSADVVYGYRILKDIKKAQLSHVVGNRFLTVFSNFLYGTKIKDMESCYKLLRRDVIDKLNLETQGFDIEAEITAKVCRLGYEIVEVPIRYNPRRFVEGKHITWWDGIRAMYVLFKCRFHK